MFSKPQCVYVPLHWPQQRLSLHSTGGREAPHLQIVTYLRYVTIFMIDTILIIIFFTIGVRSIGAAGIQFKGLQSFLTNIYTIQLGNVGIHMLAWPGKCSFKSFVEKIFLRGICNQIFYTAVNMIPPLKLVSEEIYMKSLNHKFLVYSVDTCYRMRCLWRADIFARARSAIYVCIVHIYLYCVQFLASAMYARAHTIVCTLIGTRSFCEKC